ncbi:MAG: hypothetical protein AVDCRST_MAG26-3377, partial [uncultured Chloroflexia bacterium]
EGGVFPQALGGWLCRHAHRGSRRSQLDGRVCRGGAPLQPGRHRTPGAHASCRLPTEPPNAGRADPLAGCRRSARVVDQPGRV